MKRIEKDWKGTICVRRWISSRPSLQARLASAWCTQSALQQLDSLSRCILFVCRCLWVKFRAVATCKLQLASVCYILLLCSILIYFVCFAVFAQFTVYGDKWTNWLELSWLRAWSFQARHPKLEARPQDWRRDAEISSDVVHAVDSVHSSS